MSEKRSLTPAELFEPHDYEPEILAEITRLCDKGLKPLAARAIRIGHLDEEIYDKSIALFKEFGAHRWAIPAELGGDGPISGRIMAFFTRLTAAIPGAADLALNIGATISLGNKPLTTFGSEELLAQVIDNLLDGAIVVFGQTEPDVGSNVTAIKTRAELTPSGVWEVTGTKRFITSGWKADYALVAARTDGKVGEETGISVFLVDCNAARANGTLDSSHNEKKLGLPHSPTTEMIFMKAHALGVVGPLHDGYRRVLLPTLVDSRATVIAAQACGLADACITEATRYADRRMQFGEPIAKLDEIQDMLLEMRTMRQMAWLLNLQAATLRDAYYEVNPGDSRPYEMVAALVKLFSGEVVRQVAIAGLQVHGGAGYVEDSPITRLLRDSFIVAIYEGTSQVQGLVVLKSIVRMQMRGELDPNTWPFVTIEDDALAGWSKLAEKHGVLIRRKRLGAALLKLAGKHSRMDHNQHPLFHDWVWALANQCASELMLWQFVHAESVGWDEKRRRTEGLEVAAVARAQTLAADAIAQLENRMREK